MPSKEINQNIDEAKEKLQSFEDELGFIQDAFRSLGARIESNLTKKLEAAPKAVKDIADSFQKDLTKNIEITAKNLDKISDLNADILAGKNKEKEINKAIESADSRRRTALRKINVLKNLGVKFSKTDIENLLEQYDLELDTLEALKKQNSEKQKSKSITGLLADSLGKAADKIDESGTLSMILKGNLKEALTLNRLGELAMLAFAAAALQASKNIAEIAKNTGLSYEAAKGLQEEFNQIALDSNSVNITATKLNKSFVALTKETGLIADFGGDTLETFTLLTTKLGMSEESAANMATLARLQSKDTEGILESTVGVANSLIKQSKVAVNVNEILDEVANSSNAIKLSLGLSNKELAKAATNAKLFGTNLEGVDAIASSLLNFEESIAAELEAEMLLGKELNLDKARTLALNNDLAGLAEELKDQEALTADFANMNRIQQEGAAKAIGIGRDALADIVMKQNLATMSAEEFKNAYGETTYEQMQSVSAQEKLKLTIDKMKDSLVEAGLVLAPIVDGMAKFLGYIVESKFILGSIGTLLTFLAGRQMILAGIAMKKAIFEIFAGNAKMGIFGLAASAAAVAAMMGAASQSRVSKANDMEMGPTGMGGFGDRVITGPAGSFALNNRDTVVAGTNLRRDNREAKKTNRLLQAILNRPAPRVQMDSIEVGTVAGMSAFPIQ